jgi:hypothetical protein
MGKCGDATCASNETCASCPTDCGACPKVCGDKQCYPSVGEDCSTCPYDCGTCGGCTHPLCQTGFPLAPTCSSCAATVCAVDPFCCGGGWDEVCVAEVGALCGISCAGCGDALCTMGESCLTCSDCGLCSATCGNGVCDPGENSSTCPLDCGSALTCGDGYCDFWQGEHCASRPADCGACLAGCGDGICKNPFLGGTENCVKCSLDCGPCPTWCGDGRCNANRGESCSSCSGDCGTCATAKCGNGVCDAGEGVCSCPSDCGTCSCAHSLCTSGTALAFSCDPCVQRICEVDPFCCIMDWDAVCVWEAETSCGYDCTAVCGNFVCDFSTGESCSSCQRDCGTCAGI